MNEIKYNDESVISFETKNVSIVGPNGSGKSALATRIKILNQDFTNISAHKNLSFKQGQYRSQDEEWINKNGKGLFQSPDAGGRKWPVDNNSIQDDFGIVIEEIFRDYQDKSIIAVNEKREISRKLDEVMSLWNLIFDNRELYYGDKKVEVKNLDLENSEPYLIEELSDGERVILYILIKVLLSDENSGIIIDEPETFLNPALLDNLFDLVEKARPDCKFIYFSHDLEFVTTRNDNTIFWIKEFIRPDSFAIEKIEDENIPDELTLKIVGTKKQKILFVEATENKDKKLYQKIYPDFKVWPVGSWTNVVHYTKAFNSKTEKFNKEYFGLIDRDLKTDEEIESLKESKIFVLPVSIYENLFYRKEIVDFVFNFLLGRKDDLTEEFYTNLHDKLKQLINHSELKEKYYKSKIKNIFDREINDIIKNKSDLHFDFNEFDEKLEELKEKDYDEILKFFNIKKLDAPMAEVLNCGRDSEWRDKVIKAFNIEDRAEEFRNEFLKFMPDIK